MRLAKLKTWIPTILLIFSLIGVAYAAHTNNWDETSPSNATLATSIDDEIVKVRQDVRERFAIDHKAASSDDGSDKWGVHKQVTFEQRIATPTEPTGSIATLYLKTGDKDSEIRFSDTNDVDSKIVIVGEVKMIIGSSVPGGWLALDGDSIGDASSGADQASDDYEDLYVIIYDSCADSECAVTGGRGASAAVDWAAHKPLTMPDARSRMPIGAGTGAGLTARTLGDVGGGESTNIAAHTHGVGTIGADHLHQVYNNTGGGANVDDQVYDASGNATNIENVRGGTKTSSSGNQAYYLDQANAVSGPGGSAPNTWEDFYTKKASLSGTSASGGASATQDVMNPWLALTMIIKY